MRSLIGRLWFRRMFPCFCLLLLLGNSDGSWGAEERSFVTISSGKEGGVYYPAAGVICRLVHLERSRHGIRCAVDMSSGSLENVESLTERKSDIGIVQTDVQFAAIKGLEPFARDKAEPTTLRSLFSLHSEPVTIIARLDAKVDDFADLVGKRVNVGEVGSGSFSTANVLMRAFGLSSSDLRRQLNWGAAEAATALCENRIDAMLLVVGHPSRTVRRVSESCAVKFVSISGPVADDLLKLKPYFSKAVIGAGTYVGQEEDVLSLGVRASVLVTEDMPAEMAYEITRAVLHNNERLRQLHPAFEFLELADMVRGNTAPWHPGALRYLTESELLPGRSD